MADSRTEKVSDVQSKTKEIKTQKKKYQPIMPAHNIRNDSIYSKEENGQIHRMSGHFPLRTKGTPPPKKKNHLTAKINSS